MIARAMEIRAETMMATDIAKIPRRAATAASPWIATIPTPPAPLRRPNCAPQHPSLYERIGKKTVIVCVELLRCSIARGAWLPGVEPRPYIIRFTEDRPNPLYRRVCYTFAWSAVVTFAVLNIAGLVVALISGGWYLRQIYETAYFPIAITIWLAGVTFVDINISHKFDYRTFK